MNNHFYTDSPNWNVCPGYNISKCLDNLVSIVFFCEISESQYLSYKEGSFYLLNLAEIATSLSNYFLHTNKDVYYVFTSEHDVRDLLHFLIKNEISSVNCVLKSKNISFSNISFLNISNIMRSESAYEGKFIFDYKRIIRNKKMDDILDINS